MKWYVANDKHIPYQDKTIERLERDFLKRVKPDGILFNGDIMDMYAISRFNKDPMRINTLQEDLDIAYNYLKSIRKILPKAEIIYIEGNHEARLKKFLWSKAPELANLRSLSIKELLNLDELNIKYLEECKIGDLWFRHGDVVRKHAGYSAKAMFDRHGVSMMTGHTHRDGKFGVRNRGGFYAVWENYCQCSLEPEYDPHPNWTQGWSLITFIKNRPYVEQIPVLNGSYIYGGKLWS